MDPAQQKMMAFTMPAVFGFMMWNYRFRSLALLGMQQLLGVGNSW